MSTVILTTGAPRRIGFVSTRFYGTDGVSLEAWKWARILAEQGHCSKDPHTPVRQAVVI